MKLNIEFNQERSGEVYWRVIGPGPFAAAFKSKDLKTATKDLSVGIQWVIKRTKQSGICDECFTPGPCNCGILE